LTLNRKPKLTQELRVVSPFDMSVVHCCPVSQSVSCHCTESLPTLSLTVHIIPSDPYTIQNLLFGVARAHATAGRLTFILSSKQSSLTEEVDGMEVSDFIHLY